MAELAGVYVNKNKNGHISYRASFTYKNRHISLGSYNEEETASRAYRYALELIGSDISVDSYPDNCPLIFEKFVVLCNLRDNGIYFVTPIYLEKKHFLYYYSPGFVYKFDRDDLFYFSSHKLMKRGNHLFVADYGLQVSLNERFGIRPFSVVNRDYKFINGDSTDYRRENILIINPYYGVTKEIKKTTVSYKTVVHVNGNMIVGRYSSEAEAAIAYNKAVDTLHSHGIDKNFPQNYIEGLSAREYADIYTRVAISDKITYLNV